MRVGNNSVIPIMIYQNPQKEEKNYVAWFTDGNALTWEELKKQENASKYGYSISFNETDLNECFQNCTQLRKIYLPKTITTINDAFNGCSSLEEINVDSENNNFNSINGVLFSKDETNLIRFPLKREEAYEIPSGILKIEDFAFKGCKIKEIVIPTGVTNIGGEAFRKCYSLADVTLSEAVDIGPYAFAECSSLKEIIIPNGITFLGGRIFEDSGLEKIYIPNSVTEIDFVMSPFNKCYSLNLITIDNYEDAIPGSPWGAPNNPTVEWLG